MSSKKQGPLANFGPGMEPSDEDVPLADGQIPKDIEDKVLEEIGSLQFKAVMEKLEEIDKKLDKLLKGKK